MKTHEIISLDFTKDLGSSFVRKWLFWISLAICIALFILAILLGSSAKDVIQSVVIELFSTIAALLIAYVLFVYFIGLHLERDQVEAVRPQDIKNAVETLADDHFYSFWGRSGSFLRASTLPNLDRRARERKIATTLTVILPDPDDDRLRKAYRDIVCALDEPGTDDTLKSAVAATAICLAQASADNRYLSISLYYSSFLPGFRVDLSSKGAVLTQDDPKKSALRFAPGSDFYEMFRSTIDGEKQVAKSIDLQRDYFRTQSGKRLNYAESLIKLGFGEADASRLASDVEKLIKKRQHRYK